MDSSRRAVEAYRRSRMVDGVTSDEDMVAPVYKLDEICDLLRSSHVSIVKDVSVYILKRLDHKSPLVKQKTLRLIKYAVVKSGTEFRREMQRHSTAMRQLFHYKGQPDPLKGDALNKAVRDTAHEAVSAIFASDDKQISSSVQPTESVRTRMEGFGNTNYEMPADGKKSFLSEVVGLGLSTIAAAHSIRKNETGSYKSPTLQRSLTNEVNGRDRNETVDYHRESYVSSGSGSSGTWGQDLRTSVSNTSANENTSSSHMRIKSREERLLETIVTSGGVRLQPTRDAIQVFLVEASKLDAMAMSHAIELKLHSHVWQVRMKACCVLESILRKKDDEHFSVMASYFSENIDSVVKCSELPQVSLREKANKVLSLLDGGQISGAGNSREPSDAQPSPVPAVQIPDLIDTGEPDDCGSEASTQKQVDESIADLTPSGSLVDDLFGSDHIAGVSANANRSEDDPFADVSFHVNDDKHHDDIFSGLTVDHKRSDHELKTAHSSDSAVLDVFSSNSENFLQQLEPDKNNLHDSMSGLDLNGTVQENKKPAASGFFSGASFLNESKQSSHMPGNGTLNGSLGSNSYYSMAPIHYNMPPNVMFNPAFTSQQMNYGAMGAFIAQQQLFQNLGNINNGYGHVAGTANEGGYSSALPNIFQLSNNMVPNPGPGLASPKKEETKAFDFISDHLSAARDSKRVL